MKNILTAILLYCLPFLSHSQQPENVIKVSAQAVHVDSSPVFKAMVSLGSYSSLPTEIVTLDAMKAQYKKVLEVPSSFSNN